MIMKTYFVFLSLFVLTAARQIQIKNLKEEKQLLHSSPISRPLKRSRRNAFWKKATKWFEKTAKYREFGDLLGAAKATAKAAEDAAKAAANKALCTDSNQHCAYWANLNYCTERYVPYMTVNCRQTCKICTK